MDSNNKISDRGGSSYHERLTKLPSGMTGSFLERGMMAFSESSSLSSNVAGPNRFGGISNHNRNGGTVATATVTSVPSSPHCLKKTFSVDPSDNISSSNSLLLSRVQFATPQSFCSCGCLQQFGECSFSSLSNRSFHSASS